MISSTVRGYLIYISDDVSDEKQLKITPIWLNMNNILSIYYDYSYNLKGIVSILELRKIVDNISKEVILCIENSCETVALFLPYDKDETAKISQFFNCEISHRQYKECKTQSYSITD